MALSRSSLVYLAAGDPGIWDVVKKIGKSVAGFVPGGSTMVEALGGLTKAGKGTKALALVGGGGLAALPILKRGGAILRRPGVIPGVAAAAGITAGALGARALAGMGEPRRRRRRGISATELRGFRKVTKLLSRLGMRPSIRRRKSCA